jgi:5'-nucleotidase
MGALAACALATVLVAGACSDDDEAQDASTTTAADAAASSTTAAEDDDVTVLVTNDDGVGAPGIDALVEALSERDDLEVVVVAPLENQSGSGGKTTEGPLTATEATTASGHPATAVDGFPADSVNWALGEGGITPDLVISGVNEGQNIGPAVPISGTIGAARQAAQAGVPAVAASQGLGEPPDFPTGVQAVIDWLDDNIDEVRAGTLDAGTVIDINAPTCPDGTVQGTVEVPVNEQSTVDLTEVDCAGTADPVDDVIAFTNGWIAVSRIPSTGSQT